jgi:hypothetical protein
MRGIQDQMLDVLVRNLGTRLLAQLGESVSFH